LDKNVPREYIFYLCPVGALQKQISDFAERSQAKCGWNGSHAYMPHITLSPFFTVSLNIYQNFSSREQLKIITAHPSVCFPSINKFFKGLLFKNTGPNLTIHESSHPFEMKNQVFTSNNIKELTSIGLQFMSQLMGLFMIYMFVHVESSLLK